MRLALALAGAGSSTQHPIASAAVSRAYGKAARGPLGIYNFTGDLGKASIPALTSILLVMMSWRHALLLLASAGLLVATCVALLMPRDRQRACERGNAAPHRAGGGRGGFAWLLSIGILDSAVRMGFLTFLPFLLREKGASLPTSRLRVGNGFHRRRRRQIHLRLAWRTGRHAADRASHRKAERRPASLRVLVLPLTPAIVLLPLLGVMLNGTSSVLYGTVPELSPPDRTERAFALFYTGTIGSGAIAPVLYGLLGDALGPTMATAATAATAMAICPLALGLARHLSDDAGPQRAEI